MIVDRLEYADRYVGLHPKFGAAFRYLRQLNPADLGSGRIDLDGEDLFAIVERANGKGPEGNQLEHHRKYIDIQYVHEGVETLGWSPLAECHNRQGDFDSHRDVGFFSDKPSTMLKVPAGAFAIFLPEDCHAPLLGNGPVFKIVLKVLQRPEQILEDLKAELSASSHLDEQYDEELSKSIETIESAIRENASPTESLASRLRELAQELEVSHPRLTHTVGRVADALAQIGI